MRPPRYKFPQEVRETTRAMASRMVEQGSVAHTPEELESWVAEAPVVRESLERGGYGTAFSAHDLFPLLEVFIIQAGGTVARDEPAERTSITRHRMALMVGLLLIVAVALAILVAL